MEAGQTVEPVECSSGRLVLCVRIWCAFVTGHLRRFSDARLPVGLLGTGRVLLPSSCHLDISATVLQGGQLELSDFDRLTDRVSAGLQLA